MARAAEAAAAGGVLLVFALRDTGRCLVRHSETERERERGRGREKEKKTSTGGKRDGRQGSEGELSQSRALSERRLTSILVENAVKLASERTGSSRGSMHVLQPHMHEATREEGRSQRGGRESG